MNGSIMLTQLQTPLPLETPKGKAWAVAIIDYGPQWDLQWVTFVHATGECWTFRNRDIRQQENYTFGLPRPSPISNHATRELSNNSQITTDVDYAYMRPAPPVNAKQ